MSDRGPQFRVARPEDAHAVAELHADSWQRHYRGAYSDAFLDGEPSGFLTQLWTERLATPSPQARTIVAEYNGEVVGFAHTLLNEDPTWGALVDNLHVRYTLKRQGIGTRLLSLTALAVHRWSSSSGLYLWVLEQNSMAQAFYSALGGTCVERVDVPPPGGDPARLNGRPKCLRFAWPDPSTLPNRSGSPADADAPLGHEPLRW
ncbi:GNAT family N-acetyltransferase [Pseudonocardia nigra]|uniref:GNAT family N-acetyltransferase n=1 Tax=Pseudonocardia nigra TaxID=1921578 RepID=UPI001FE57E93|nr:GNAT family N-acetyltransferase [Pseudonocardia nigra]